MKKFSIIYIFLIQFIWATDQPSFIIKGSGATFPYPLYMKWIEEYSKISDTKIIYEPVGSGQGIEDLINNRVDFGGTDVFLSNEELENIEDLVIHVPTCLGAIVFTYNLPVDKPINLSKKTLIQMLTGRIKRWNSYLIQSENPDIKLPDKEITLVHRSDDSGSTYVLTSYLSKISREWQRKYGVAKHFHWDLGIGVEGNENIAKFVSKIPGSIGYVSFTFAKNRNLPVAKIENENGNYILPTIESISKSAEIKIPEDVRINLVASENESSYPISTFSYVIFKLKRSPEERDLPKLQAGYELFQWMLTEGQKYNEQLYYAPVPKNVAKKVYNILK